MRERAVAALLAAASLAGCTSLGLHRWAHPEHTACDLRPIRAQVGAPATRGRLKRMTRDSRASELRVIRPNLWHGAEVKPTRLTVTVDAGNRITTIACG